MAEDGRYPDEDRGGYENEPAGEAQVESDVFLDVPTLKVEEIDLEVEDLRAHVSLQAEVLDLVKLNVGVDVALGQVKLDIKGVEAQAMLKVRLDNVRDILHTVLATIDRNPEILERVGRTVESTVSSVGEGAADTAKELGAGAGSAAREISGAAGQVATGLGDASAGAVEGARDTAGEVAGTVDKAGSAAGAAADRAGDAGGESAADDWTPPRQHTRRAARPDTEVRRDNEARGRRSATWSRKR